MKYQLSFCCFLVITGGLLLGGCGGVTPNSDSTTRGEGTIPIGKISTKPVVPVQFMATYQNGYKYEGNITEDGTIYMPLLPYGEANLSVMPGDEQYEPADYKVNIKAQQRYIISVGLQPKGASASVESLALEVPNAKEMQVGKTYPIKVTLNGKNTANLKPTVWVNGGAGSIDTGLRFLALVPGEATICAKIGNLEATLPIVVY